MSGLFILGLRILAAIALYAFLGSALFLLWRSLQLDAQALLSRQIIPLDLLISFPDGEDHIFHVAQNHVAIGRDPDCDCVLPHVTVSSHHARLTFHHLQWWVDDLFSTNGTKLNDEFLKQPTVIVNGDELKCGQIKLKIILEIESQPTLGGK